MVLCWRLGGVFWQTSSSSIGPIIASEKYRPPRGADPDGCALRMARLLDVEHLYRLAKADTLRYLRSPGARRVRVATGTQCSALKATAHARVSSTFME